MFLFVIQFTRVIFMQYLSSELQGTSLIKYLTPLRISTCKVVHTANPDVGIKKEQYAYSYLQ